MSMTLSEAKKGSTEIVVLSLLARLVKMLLSNCAFDRGSLSPTYVKPFDLFAKSAETGNWLTSLDSNQEPSD